MTKLELLHTFAREFPGARIALPEGQQREVYEELQARRAVVLDEFPHARWLRIEALDSPDRR